MLVGIDLFVPPLYEGVQLTKAAGPVTYPPQLARRQPPKRLGVGACSGFGRSRSERVFRNEFPYLGRAGLAAWAGFRLVGGNGTDRRVARARGAGPGPGSGAPLRRRPSRRLPRRPPRRRRPHRPPRRRRRRPLARPPPAASPPDQQVQLIYAPWTKFCLKGQDANAKQVCFTGKDGRIESGQPVIAAVIIEPEGEPKKILRVTLPLGMQLVHGTRVIVDSNPPRRAPM